MRVTTGGFTIGLPRRAADTGRAGARGLITRAAGFPSRAWAFLSAEGAGQAGRLMLWVPVAFGIGSASYLALKSEPPLWPAATVAGILVVVAFATARLARREWPIAVAVLAALCAAGFAAAKLHSDSIVHPIAPAGMGFRRLEGFVVDVASPSESGERILIAPARIAGLAPEVTPRRVRIILADGAGPEAAPPPGSAISVYALIDPPPSPAAPGAYDFARDAWFEEIGGVGLAKEPPAPITLPAPPWRLRLEMAVNALRWRVAGNLVADIRAALGPDDGGAAGLAAAVTTSHQDWLDPEWRNDLRGSGLAHMLAIAGLHTAAVSGFAFFAFRLLIAAIPWLALRVNGKKVAAAAALAVVAGYLVLSGAHPPARRAAITASVAFAAILFDRRAVSMHSLAIAALLILVMEPDVVVQPGFEMSFCATASLVALAELWQRSPRPIALPWPLRLVQGARDWTFAMFMVSLVAGAATGPFAIQHFNRVANYGVFANLLADFLASAVLMPMLGLCLLIEALGLSGVAGPVFWLAGWAARGVVGIAAFFANARGAAIAWPSAPQEALIVSYLGIVFACLWKGRLRWIGVPMAAAVALWPRPAPPVAWIAADGDDAALVVGREEVAMKPAARAYATGLFAQRHGLSLPAFPAAASEALFACDRKGCVPTRDAHPAIGAWWGRKPPSPKRFAALCRASELIVLRGEADPAERCPGAILLTGADFARLGAAEVYRTPTGLAFLFSQPIRGDRPWSRAPSGLP